MMRDNILLYEDRELSQSKCFSCQGLSHDVLSCPSIRYVPNRELVIKRYLHNKKIDLKGFKRKRKIKGHWNALNKTNFLTELREIIENQYDLSEYEEEINKLRSNFSVQVPPFPLRNFREPILNSLAEISRSDSSHSEKAMDSPKEEKENPSRILKENPSRILSREIDQQVNLSPRKKKKLKILQNEELLQKMEKDLSVIRTTDPRSVCNMSETVNPWTSTSVRMRISELNIPKRHSKKLTTFSNQLQSQVSTRKKQSIVNVGTNAPVSLTSFFFFALDSGKIFKGYFPKNNIDNVLLRVRFKFHTRNRPKPVITISENSQQKDKM